MHLTRIWDIYLIEKENIIYSFVKNYDQFKRTKHHAHSFKKTKLNKIKNCTGKGLTPVIIT